MSTAHSANMRRALQSSELLCFFFWNGGEAKQTHQLKPTHAPTRKWGRKERNQNKKRKGGASEEESAGQSKMTKEKKGNAFFCPNPFRTPPPPPVRRNPRLSQRKAKKVLHCASICFLGVWTKLPCGTPTTQRRRRRRENEKCEIAEA